MPTSCNLAQHGVQTNALTCCAQHVVANMLRSFARAFTVSEYKGLKARANERNMLCQHVGHNMLRSFVHHVGLCCMMLAYVASSLKPVKLFAQHMPTFLLFSGDR